MIGLPRSRGPTALKASGSFREAYEYSMRGVATASREDRPYLLVCLYSAAVEVLAHGALGPTFTLEQVDQLLTAHAAALDRCSAWIPNAVRKRHSLPTRWKSQLGIPARGPSNRCSCLHYFLRTRRDAPSFNVRLADMQADSSFQNEFGNESI